LLNLKLIISMTTLDNPNPMAGEAPIGPTITRYGVIGGLIFVVYGLLGNIIGFARPSAGMMSLALNGLISLGLYIGLMVIAIRHYRDNENGGVVTFGRAFLVGLGIALIVAVFNTLFSYIYMNFIEPDYLETTVREIESRYESLGMSEEQIETMMVEAQKNMSPGKMVIQGVLFSGIFGAIVAAIVAAIMKRNPDSV